MIVQNVTNAATAESTGIEFDARIALTEWLEVGGSGAYQEAEYDSFVNGTCTIASGLSSPCDQSGQPLHLAPDWSANLYADVSFPLTDALELSANVNASFSDDYFHRRLARAGRQAGPLDQESMRASPSARRTEPGASR